jgi:hypothetical protein
MRFERNIKTKVINYAKNKINFFEDVPLESREVATMLEAEENAIAKQSAKEKSPSPTSNILWQLL